MCYSPCTFVGQNWSHRCSDFLFTYGESVDLQLFLWSVGAALPKETKEGY